jgi:triosephosphate isomerase
MGVLIGTSSKMNLTSTEAAGYLDALLPMVDDIADRDLFVLLPFTSIWVARDRLTGTNLRWGAQDVHPDDAGAHTGDVSAPMLGDLGCAYVEVGHHERRRDYGESDELIAAKVAAAQRWGMTAIACVGEQRRVTMGEAIDELGQQLRLLLASNLARLVIAYEPAWAIGVGARSASPRWVGRIHAAIRTVLAESGASGRLVPIIYGGSVSPATAGALLAQRDVDGLFVGRLALDPRVFATIAHTSVQR